MAMQLTYTLKPASKTITSMLLSRSGASSSNGGGYGNGNMDELIKTNKAWKGNNVLQRKTEEASQATKRLKELLETRKVSSREALSGAGGNGPEYERQIEERARMAKEVARLKEENELLRNSNIRLVLSGQNKKRSRRDEEGRG